MLMERLCVFPATLVGAEVAQWSIDIYICKHQHIFGLTSWHKWCYFACFNLNTAAWTQTPSSPPTSSTFSIYSTVQPHLWDERSSDDARRPALQFPVHTVWPHWGSGCFSSAVPLVSGFGQIPLCQIHVWHLEMPQAGDHQAKSGSPWRNLPVLHLGGKKEKVFFSCLHFWAVSLKV